MTWVTSGDVQAARGHVGRHEQVQRTVAEVLQDFLALPLAQTAVDRVCLVFRPLQRAGEAINRHLGVAEHDRLRGLLVVEHVAQAGELVALGNLVVDLLDLRDGHLFGLHGDQLRRAHVARGQAPDHQRHRGGEEGSLAIARDPTEDPLDVGHEAHVQHAVRLVEDQQRTPSKCKVPRPMWSRMRPGVPTTICAPASRAFTWSRMLAPP